MLQYILECISFQLVFLIIYDLFLKRETFFQWNRLYLIGGYIVAIVLPWIKIEAMKTTVPEAFQGYPEFLWAGNDAAITATAVKETAWSISWEYSILFGGMFLAALFFGYKLYQIYALKRKGAVHYFQDFTQVIISNSSIAFSFFKSIFLGDKVIEKDHQSIVQHELVHIRQRHTYDLMFFELMRIVGWFNPLVYMYQSRISELHEFIADAQVAKTNKKKQYEFLLSQVFQTQNISFINQFFNSSLIKKRIVMLTKGKSKRIYKLKYLLLLPIIIGMLLYTSCQTETLPKENRESSLSDKIEALELEINSKDSLTIEEKVKLAKLIYTTYPKDTKGISGKEGEITYSGIPFAVVDEAPIFAGCEDENDKRLCFNEKIQKHISKNFNYPKEALEKGIQGRVSVLFYIDPEGNINNIKMRGPDKLLENEAERIIKKLPRMKPGKHKGKEVYVPFSIPITFKLK